jgi:hypothetical protein
VHMVKMQTIKFTLSSDMWLYLKESASNATIEAQMRLYKVLAVSTLLHGGEIYFNKTTSC